MTHWLILFLLAFGLLALALAGWFVQAVRWPFARLAASPAAG